ncbi:hypothetical protein GCM10011515_23790 [Tsuneonella deserti]|uniref:Carbon storage regulator n=1 Tax=Tsuneonella deserti TaxID=2035528 RepID=A0ABQ1SAJ1_9SPHN|nr:hypothetical protein [Tsuneonella deserti]GGE03434.1 hypothetical protein GCM10011515_23790 [Tsuneonella deserti]
MLIRIRLHLAALDHREVIGTAGEEVYVRVEQIGGMVTLGKRKPNRAQVLLIRPTRQSERLFWTAIVHTGCADS